MQEFKINEFISLRFENGRTFIYIGGEKFKICAFALIYIPINKFQKYDQIESIDEAIELLGTDLENIIDDYRETIGVSAEQEYWAHCSNLQAWAEYNYDTRLLDSKLSFPLLKRLTEVGDKKATIAFKEEIGKRLTSERDEIWIYLYEEGYVDYLSRDEFWSFFPPEAEALQQIESLTGFEFKYCSNLTFPQPDQLGIKNSLGFSTKNGKIKSVAFTETTLPKGIGWSQIFEILAKISTLRGLFITFSEISSIPESIGKLTSLKILNLSHNSINSVPESIGKLRKLESLRLHDNCLTSLPDSIGNLKSLKTFYLFKNNFKTLPLSIKNISCLKTLISKEKWVERLIKKK
ncbi:MAG: leucine-rich repeat domain-containing protein [Promethearchaeota archaeon]